MKKLKTKEIWVEPQVDFLPSLHGGAESWHLAVPLLGLLSPRVPIRLAPPLLYLLSVATKQIPLKIYWL